MSIRGIQRSIGAALAIVILLTALVGYLPTSNCHCRDSKATKAQKVHCPFGQLRSLSISLTADPVIDFAVALGEIPVKEISSVNSLKGSSLYLAFDAQAPPLLL